MTPNGSVLKRALQSLLPSFKKLNISRQTRFYLKLYKPRFLDDLAPYLEYNNATNLQNFLNLLKFNKSANNST
jgi:hypothetical protein